MSNWELNNKLTSINKKKPNYHYSNYILELHVFLVTKKKHRSFNNIGNEFWTYTIYDGKAGNESLIIKSAWNRTSLTSLRYNND